jgi:predicted DNA-binding transcriptional regulator AlpA
MTKRAHIDARDVIAAWVQQRGRRGLENDGSAPVRVLNLDEVAKRADTTRRNIERLIAAGTGPAVVKISPRRVGVLEEDFAAWLRAPASCARQG